MVYNSFYMASLLYVTTATSLTYKVWDALRKSVVNAILPKMGINNAYRSVTFAMTNCCGIGIDHLAAIQCYRWMKYLMGHLHCKSNRGQLMKMLIEFTYSSQAMRNINQPF
jgi:hypothetical protein